MKESKVFYNGMNKKKVTKAIAITCLAIFTTVNSGSVVMAAPTVKTNVEISKSLKGEKEDSIKQIPQNIENDKFVVAKTMNDAKAQKKIPQAPKQGKKATGFKAEVGVLQYTLTELKAMSYTQMMDAIASTTWEGIPGLFKDTAESRAFFNDTERLNYIISDLGRRGEQFTANDNKGIPTIIEVIRAATYLQYNNPSGFLGVNSTKVNQSSVAAMKKIMNNINFNYGTAIQDEMVEAIGSLIGNTTSDPELTELISKKVFKAFRENIKSYAQVKSKYNAFYKVIGSISGVYTGEAYNNKDKSPSQYPSYGKIDGLLEEFLQIGVIQGLGSNDQWIADNGMYYFKQLDDFYGNEKRIVRMLTDYMKSVQKYGVTYYELADEIEMQYGALDADGVVIDYKKLQADGEKYWLSKTYTFDDGAMVIHASEKTPEETIKRLYWATKEVESQFFRVNGNDKALEPNNTDKVLTMKIFGTPEEYKLNYYINGISTDNGGMYVEPQGTFYTFDRKCPEENVYTLEELFRHEFTHYLQGKYQVPGMWGTGDFYQNGELNWFDEGTAEFFAGSTRTESVKQRRAIVNYLDWYGQNPFSLKELFSATYDSNWMFYNYGWAGISYLYQNDIETLMKLNDSILNNKINDFKNILNSVANNAEAEAGYKKYMKDSISNSQSIGTPLVGDAYTATHEKRNISQIKQDIISVSGVQSLTEDKTTSKDFSTFKLSGKYVGGTSQGKVADWKVMNEKANSILKELSKKGWSGYDTVTCYFTDYKVVNGKFEFNIVFRGLLNDNSTVVVPENKVPTAKIEAISSGKVNETISFKGDLSSDEDGNIVSYEWNFGDNTVINNEKNPTHVFSKVGTYNVTLKVTDDKGAIGETSLVVTVAENGTVIPSGALTQEVEKNDSYEDADKNGFIGNNVEVKGSLKDYSDKDIYAFEVEKSGKVNINLTRSNSNMTWVVYKSTDLGSYQCWLKQIDGNKTSGSFDATEGKYYIVVYPTGSVSNTGYSIVMDGIKSYSNTEVNPPIESNNIYEAEPNDKVSDNMVSISEGVNAIGQLKQGGDTDIFAIDVNTAKEVEINVNSKDTGYTWVVFKENNENNFVCWSQYSTENGSKGSFQASPGRYFIKLYSLNNNKVDYSVNIKGLK